MQSKSFPRYIAIEVAALFLLMPALAFSQAPGPKTTLAVKGFSGNAPVIQVNGKSYVEIESLARITNSSLTFQANQIVFTFASLAASPAPGQTEPPARLTKDVLKAAIDEITAIEEWRTAIVTAIQNNSPMTQDWIDGYRRNADTKLALASVPVATDPDRTFVALLRNEFNNMQKVSDTYMAMRKSQAYISEDSVNNDPLNQQVQSCAHALAAVTANSQIQDVVACH
jgi:hypothetical protein